MLDFRGAAAGIGGALQPLLMAYVDNSQNVSNVYIYFDDTQYVITVLAGEVGYFPLITNRLYCVVYNGSVFGTAYSGFTNIVFCNFATPGFANSNITIPFNRISGAGATKYGPNSVGTVKSSAMAFLNGVSPPQTTTILTTVANNDQIITSFDLPLFFNGSTLYNYSLQAYQANTPGNILFNYPFVPNNGNYFVGTLVTVPSCYIYLANGNGNLILKWTSSGSPSGVVIQFGMNFQYLLVPLGAG
jgi:hypothetical protein